MCHKNEGKIGSTHHDKTLQKKRVVQQYTGTGKVPWTPSAYTPSPSEMKKKELMNANVFTMAAFELIEYLRIESHAFYDGGSP